MREVLINTLFLIGILAAVFLSGCRSRNFNRYRFLIMDSQGYSYYTNQYVSDSGCIKFTRIRSLEYKESPCIIYGPCTIIENPDYNSSNK